MRITKFKMRDYIMKEKVGDLLSTFIKSTPEQILPDFIINYMDKIALASSLGPEDQVLTDMILKINPNARIFMIDTGRLNQETYDVAVETMKRYSMHYEIYFPKNIDVEVMENLYGPNLFYDSIEMRKYCCQIRKIEPFKRALKNHDVWITGLRREQAVTRINIDKIEWDDTNKLIKLNPLTEWTADMIWNYIKEHKVPYNKLHDMNYPSIGCAPCTRAVKNGENIRSGRWWWEAPEHKECGLHNHNENDIWRNQQ